MKIGIDLDNTLCNTNIVIEKYMNIYIKDKNIIKEYLWENSEYKNNFLKKYLENIYLESIPKNNSVKVINNLLNKHKLCIVTARTSKYIDKDVNFIVKQYLKKYSINIDEIYCEAGDKVDFCINNNVDIMIDDSVYNCTRLKENKIKTILYDEENKYDWKYKVNNWNDLENRIEEIMKKIT